MRASLIVVLLMFAGACGASEHEGGKEGHDDPAWIFLDQDHITVARVEIPFGTEAFRLWTESLDPKVEYQLVAHADLEYRVVQQLMEAMAKVGATKLQFRMVDPREGKDEVSSDPPTIEVEAGPEP